MTTIEVHVDSRTEDGLRRFVEQDREDISVIASRLLARAVRAARPRVHFDAVAIREANSPYAEEDTGMADSASEERATLLKEEDEL